MLNIERTNPDLLVSFGQDSLNAMNADQLSDEVRNLLAENPQKNLNIDMTGITYCSSAGLRVFLQAHLLLEPEGNTVILQNLNHQIRHLFKIAEVDTLFEFQDK